MSSASDFFETGGGTGVGLFPNFPPKRPTQVFLSGRPEGFAGNGDFFVLPVAATSTNLDYKNNAGVVVWSKAITDIHASADHWVTFSLDAVDARIWVIVGNDTTDTLYLANIDAAGTITNVGSGVTPIDVNVTAWNAFGSGRGGNMWREAEGGGNFTLQLSNTEIVIDSITGAIISANPAIGLVAGSFKSTEGVYFSPAGLQSTGAPASTMPRQTITIRKRSNFSNNITLNATLYAPLDLGLMVVTSSRNEFTHLQWKNDVLLVAAGSTTLNLPTLYDRVEYLAAVDQLVTNFRMDQ